MLKSDADLQQFPHFDRTARKLSPSYQNVNSALVLSPEVNEKTYR